VFKGDNNSQHVPFGAKVKPEVPCRKILRHVKKSLTSMKKYFARPNSSFLTHVLSACYKMSAGRISGEVWWTNQEFSSDDIIPV
jgi:hypothetical protein